MAYRDQAKRRASYLRYYHRRRQENPERVRELATASSRKRRKDPLKREKMNVASLDYYWQDREMERKVFYVEKEAREVVKQTIVMTEEYANG